MWNQSRRNIIPLHKLLQRTHGDVFSKNVSVSPTSLVASYRYKTIATKEPETILWIKSFTENTVFLDIGSNIGVYSLAAYSLGVSAVYSIDPLPHNIFELFTTIHTNRISNIFPICAYISSDQNLVGVSPDPLALDKHNQVRSAIGDFAGSGVIIDPSTKPGCHFSPALTQSQFKQLSSVGITDIKIDVDGSECDVINAISPLLQSSSFRSIAIEARSTTLNTVSQLLNRYSIFEQTEFRDLSDFNKRIESGRDAMVLFSR